MEATDDQTVVITLSEANIEFLAYLTEAIIPADYDGQDTHPIGTGPFQFVSRTPQEGMVIEKFEDYWGTPAYLDRVEYRVITSADTLMMLSEERRGGSVRPPDQYPKANELASPVQHRDGFYEAGTGPLSEQRGGAL